MIIMMFMIAMTGAEGATVAMASEAEITVEAGMLAGMVAVVIGITIIAAALIVAIATVGAPIETEPIVAIVIAAEEEMSTGIATVTGVAGSRLQQGTEGG